MRTLTTNQGTGVACASGWARDVSVLDKLNGGLMDDQEFSARPDTAWVDLVDPAQVNDDLVRDISELLSQLRGTPSTVSAEDILEIISWHKLFVARVRDEQRRSSVSGVGMCCVVEQILPQGKRALLESFVVNSSYRNLGTGGLMLDAVTDDLKKNGFPVLNLTCNNSRDAALSFYQDYGFKLADTNVFRLYLKD